MRVYLDMTCFNLLLYFRLMNCTLLFRMSHLLAAVEEEVSEEERTEKSAGKKRPLVAVNTTLISTSRF